MSDGVYYRVSPRFWRDRAVKAWDDQTRLLAYYMLNNDHRTTEGLFYMPKQYAAVDMGWTAAKLDAAWSRLVADGFMGWDADADVVLIHRAVFYQPPANEKVVKAAVRRLADVPSSPLLVVFGESLGGLEGKVADVFRAEVDALIRKRFPNGIETVSKRYAGETETVSRVEHSSQETSSNSLSLSLPPSHTPSSGKRFDSSAWDAWWSLYPRKVGKKAAEAKYRAALKLVDADELHAALQTQVTWWIRKQTEPQFIPHPATWLSQGRWDDQPEQPVSRPDDVFDRPMTEDEQLAAIYAADDR